MTFEQAALQIGGGALIGYVTGWGLKKILRIVVKLIAIALAAFFSALLYLEVQKIVTVNWKEIENQTSNAMSSIANATVNSAPNSVGLNQVMDTLGILFAGPMGLAFVAGFMKG